MLIAMKNTLRPAFGILAVLATALTCPAQPSLTIYNQNFATVRDHLALDLQAGSNDVRFADTTAHVEPDSVILRDAAGKIALHVLEQNYRADPISSALLLSMNEGQTIDFMVPGKDGNPDRTVKGKIIRSGYVAHSDFAMRRYGNAYAQSQGFRAYGIGNDSGQSQPIIEVEGKLQFSLPGEPRFSTSTLW